MRINPNIVTATLPSGNSFSSVTGGRYPYRHLDAVGGGHILTVALFYTGVAHTNGAISITAIPARNPGAGSITLASIPYATFDATPGALYTFNLTGHFDIDVSNAIGAPIEVQISS